MTAEDETAIEDAVCRCVHGLIPTLKSEYAEILTSVEIQGASVRDVAARLGITPGATPSGFTGHAGAEDPLETTCGTCTEHGCLECSCGESPGV